MSPSAESWKAWVDIRSRRRRYKLELLAEVQATDRRDVDSVVHLSDTDVPIHPSRSTQCTDPG